MGSYNMDLSIYYACFSTLNLVAVIVCVFYGKKLYDSTRGAADFWLFLSAFIFSLGGFVLFDFVSKTILFSFRPVIMAAQDLSIAFAAIFALLSAVYIKKMFDEMLGE